MLKKVSIGLVVLPLLGVLLKVCARGTRQAASGTDEG